MLLHNLLMIARMFYREKLYSNYQRIYRVVNEFVIQGRSEAMSLSSRALGPFAAIRVRTVYLETMGISLVNGRNLPTEFSGERIPVLVNESLVAHMNWEQPIGKQVGDGDVIGVVEDFHFSPLYEEIAPLVIRPIADDYSRLYPIRRDRATRPLIVNISGDDVASTSKQMEDTIRKFDAEYIHDPEFHDERLGLLYESETNMTKLVAIFAILNILLTLVGLYGLTAYSAEQRSKEIGIRKMLGVSEIQITRIFLDPLVLLVLVASIPSSFVSFLVVSGWLENFSYRIELDIWPFLWSNLLVASTAISAYVSNTQDIES